MSKRLATVLVGLTLVFGACDRSAGSSPSPHAQQLVPVDPHVKVRAELAAHRAQELDRMREYSRAGAFPVNTTQDPTGHFFKDAAGHYCAVANLVHQDGRDDLVDAVVRTNNALVISEVHDGPLHDWILASGFTQEELARIQLPAPMVRSPSPRPTLVAAKPSSVITVDQMREAVRAHLATVLAELLRDTDESLDRATDRLLQAHPPAAT
jgi:hypothetical protein